MFRVCLHLSLIESVPSSEISEYELLSGCRMKILIEKSQLAFIRIEPVLGLLEAVTFVGISDVFISFTGFLKRGDKFLRLLWRNLRVLFAVHLRG